MAAGLAGWDTPVRTPDRTLHSVRIHIESVAPVRDGGTAQRPEEALAHFRNLLLANHHPLPIKKTGNFKELAIVLAL